MPKAIVFNNRLVVEPGAYSKIEGGIPAPAASANLGNVLFIDTGSCAGWRGGSGVNGTNDSGVSSIYEFTDYPSLKTWVRGGLLYDLAKFIFTPEENEKGASTLSVISACTTTPATLTQTLTNGTITITTIAEGLAANGVLTSTRLSKGFATKIVAGVTDTSKYIYQFWASGYAGAVDSYENDKAEIDSTPKLIFQSPEVSNLSELRTFLLNDTVVKSWLKSAVVTITTTGALASGDKTSGFVVLAGGTETYNSTDVDSVLEAIAEYDYNFVVIDKYGVVNGKGVEATKLFNHIKNDSTYQTEMIIGGGIDNTELSQTGASSHDLAKYYNSGFVTVVHGNVLLNLSNGGYRTYNTLYHAASLAGRKAGVASQIGLTWKSLIWDGVAKELSKKQRENALLAGVVHLKKKDGKFVINQEVTTLQQNSQITYPSGESPEGQIMRIASQLNREIKKNCEDKFVGVNAAMADDVDISNFVKTYLGEKVATKTVDNLLLSFKNVVVTRDGNDVTVNYGFRPNGVINRLFITGIMFNI